MPENLQTAAKRPNYRYKLEMIQQTEPLALMAAEINAKVRDGWRVVTPLGARTGMLILCEREILEGDE